MTKGIVPKVGEDMKGEVQKLISEVLVSPFLKD